MFPDGELVVPARSPYDREAVFEHVDGAVKRFGDIRLELNYREWRVMLTNGGTHGRCFRCRQPLSGSIFVQNTRELCVRCVKRDAAPQSMKEVSRGAD